MSFPENRLSTTLVASDYLYPYNLVPPNRRTAYALGGVALGDTSQGLRVQLWTAYVEGDNILLTAPNMDNPIVLLATPEGQVTELTFTFDQNMNATIAYMQLGEARLYWFDTFVGEYVISSYSGVISPRVTLDDDRELETSLSDMIFGYVRQDNLYFRMQRERFLSEHLLKENVQARLEQMGMNVKNRLQFKLKPFRT